MDRYSMSICIGVLLLMAGASVPVSADWAVEIADDAAHVGRYSSIQIDSLDRPHISYYDETNGNLKYTYKSGTGWQHDTVYTTGTTGTFTDLALDSNDNPWISYYDQGTASIRMAFKISGAWYHQGIAQTGANLPISAIALNSQGHFYVAYMIEESGLYKLRITYFDGYDLYFHYVESDAAGVGDFSMVMSGSDEPCLSYDYPITAYTSNLKYATHNSGSWQHEINNSDENAGYHSSMKLDSNGYPHVAHQNNDAYLVYSYRDASGWHNTVTTYPVSAYICMDLDSDGYPHVVSTGGTHDAVSHFYLDAGGWHEEVIFTQTVAGAAYPSLAIDSQDIVHVSFYSRDDYVLRYARRFDPPTPTPTNTPVIPTPTPTICAETGVTIKMPFRTYSAGDTCFCRAYVCNAENTALTGYPLFVILDVYQNYFFAPSFNSVFDNYLEMYPSFPVGLTTVEVLPSFSWPTGAGSADGIIWYGALTTPAMTDLFGELGTFTFEWTD